MDELRRSIGGAAASATWYEGTRGLYLNIVKLSSLGADSVFLDWWEYGRPLEAMPMNPTTSPNYRSLLANPTWAEKEWSRLEGLGKVEFFPRGAEPPGLNVNPCARLLKHRPEAPTDAPKEDRYKARLICDLSTGHVNSLLPHWDVHYGSIDLAISRMTQGAWLYVVDLADAFLSWKVRAEHTFLLFFFSPVRQQHGRYL